MAVIPVALAGREYDVVIEEGLLGRLAEAAAPFLKGYGAARRVPFVADTNTQRLYGESVAANLAAHGLTAEWFVVEPGEDAKTGRAREAVRLAAGDGCHPQGSRFRAWRRSGG